MTTWRRARAPIAWSWVTTISVTPLAFRRFEQGDHLFAGVAVEVAGRLIGQNQRRLHDGGAGDRHALALAAGELVGPMVGAVLQAEAGERPGDAGVALPGRNAGQGHRQRDILGGGQARHQMEALENEPDAFAAHPRLLVGREGGHVAPSSR
jgi:hypothetical protein